jgi:HSP20 family protein
MKPKSNIPVSRDQRGAPSSVWQPFGLLQREIDRVFEDFAGGFKAFGTGGVVPSVDMAETEKEIEFTAELPGLEEKDVQLSVADNRLTIQGEKKLEKEQSDKDYRFVERSYGSFSRTLDLPPGVNPDSISATITKGVLKVVVPKPAATQAKKIDIKSAA